MGTRLLLGLAALVSCSGGSGPVAASQEIREVQIRLGDAQVSARFLYTYRARRHDLPRHFRTLGRGEALLLKYPRRRYHHLFRTEGSSSWALQAAFLDEKGKVLELAHFPYGREGITSREETPYVLIADEDAFRRAGVTRGSNIELPEPVRSQRAEPLPTVRIGDVEIEVELSLTYEERQRGLMYRRRMSENEGMLFCYSEDDTRSYWMGYCLMDMSIAFIRSDGEIARIHHDMLRYSDPLNPPHEYQKWPSEVPVRYALEVNHGFLRKHNIREGMKAVLPDIIGKEGFEPE